MAKLIAAAVLLAAVVVAGAPGADIVPGNPVPPYTLVRINTDATADVWILSIRDGQIVPVDSYTSADGTTIFTGPPGTYAVLGRDEDGRFQHIVEIGGVVPPFPPGPEPEPEPKPPENDRVSQVRTLAEKYIPVAHRDGARAVADVYRRVASRIGVDLFTPASIRSETRKETTVAVAPHLAEFTPFFEEFAKYLFAWSQEEQRDNTEYQQLWKEIAQALESIHDRTKQEPGVSGSPRSP